MTATGESLPTVTELLLARAEDANPGLVFEGTQWSWMDHVQECADRAALLRSLRRPGPFHVGVLLDNVPEFSFLLGGAALAGAVLVGLNTGRRGGALVRDIELADCQVVLTDSRYVELLQGLEIDARVLDIDSAAWHVTAFRHRHAPLDPVPATPDDLLMLIFTSGTSGEPKAVRVHARQDRRARADAGRALRRHGRATPPTSRCPCSTRTAIMAGWAVGLAAGARLALRRRFSASGFLADVRGYGVTYANYVGKPLAYILSHPVAARRRREPAAADVRQRGRPARRRRVRRAVRLHGDRRLRLHRGRHRGAPPADMPAGALGQLDSTLAVLDPETGEPCPPAVFDEHGRLTNEHEAVGELVNTAGSGHVRRLLPRRRVRRGPPA